MVGVEELEGCRLIDRFRKKFDEFVFGLQRRAEPRTSYEHAPSTSRSHIQWYRKCEQPGHLRSIPLHESLKPPGVGFQTVTLERRSGPSRTVGAVSPFARQRGGYMMERLASGTAGWGEPCRT